MNQHLSDEQIAQWMWAERSEDASTHVAGCGECRRQIEALAGTLLEFREAARDYAACCEPRPVLRAATPRRPLLAVAWAVAAGLAVAAVVFPVYRDRRQKAAADALADAALLKQVDAELSRAVPEPMEPLVSLVSSGSPAQGEN